MVHGEVVSASFLLFDIVLVTRCEETIVFLHRTFLMLGI